MNAHDVLIMANLFYRAIQRKYARIPSAGMLFYCPTDNTVFLAHRSANMNSPNTWDIPGGRPEDSDDSPLETATREVYEEVGAVPKNKKPAKHYVIKHNEHHYIVYIYVFSPQEKEELTQKAQFSDENDAFNWFDISALPTDVHFDLSWIPIEVKSLSQEL